MSTNLVQSAVRTARGRLIRQAFLNRVSLSLAIGVGVALVWFFLQPLLLQDSPGWLRWTVLGTATFVALAYTVWQTRRQAPTQQAAALEVDSRRAVVGLYRGGPGPLSTANRDEFQTHFRIVDRGHRQAPSRPSP